MNHTVFRKKSLETISSPDQLYDYIKVTSGGIWLAIGTLILLLIGACVWGVFGSLETVVNGKALVENNQAILYLTEDAIATVSVNDEIRIGSKTGHVTNISEKPLSFTTICDKLGQDEYTIYSLGIENQRFLYEITAEVPEAQNGIVQTQIITEIIKPMNFVFN